MSVKYKKLNIEPTRDSGSTRSSEEFKESILSVMDLPQSQPEGSLSYEFYLPFFIVTRGGKNCTVSNYCWVTDENCLKEWFVKITDEELDSKMRKFLKDFEVGKSEEIKLYMHGRTLRISSYGHRTVSFKSERLEKTSERKSSQQCWIPELQLPLIVDFIKSAGLKSAKVWHTGRKTSEFTCIGGISGGVSYYLTLSDSEPEKTFCMGSTESLVLANSVIAQIVSDHTYSSLLKYDRKTGFCYLIRSSWLFSTPPTETPTNGLSDDLPDMSSPTLKGRRFSTLLDKADDKTTKKLEKAKRVITRGENFGIKVKQNSDVSILFCNDTNMMAVV